MRRGLVLVPARLRHPGEAFLAGAMGHAIIAHSVKRVAHATLLSPLATTSLSIGGGTLRGVFDPVPDFCLTVLPLPHHNYHKSSNLQAERYNMQHAICKIPYYRDVFMGTL